MTPSFDVFCRQAKTGNLIPVYQEILADTETPVSAFLKLQKAEATFAYLLESVEGGETWARYSFVSVSPAILTVKGFGNIVEIVHGDTYQRLENENPLHFLKKMLARFTPVVTEGLPRFWGGAVGFIGYEGKRFFETNTPSSMHALDPEGNPEIPDLFFTINDTLLIFDHLAHTIKVVSYALLEGNTVREAYDKAVKRITDCVYHLEAPYDPQKEIMTIVPHLKAKTDLPLPLSNRTRESFCDVVRTAQEYIGAGDIFQVQISQRFSIPLQSLPFDLYRALRHVNPSPYMYYLQCGDLQVVGTSPEVLVRLEGRHVETRPIAGTRRRGRTDEEDDQLEEELLSDPKERAEHIMLVDLSRNDIGRVCEYGSVRVDHQMIIERYSHVMHIVSSVVGRLKETHDAFDLLKACFPAGTVTGAPKIRAMEIIDELEQDRRGLYAGAVGYFGFNGNMDMWITIRTIIIHDKIATVQAAAGIVADSDPDQEYKETLNKARGMLEVVAKG